MNVKTPIDIFLKNNVEMVLYSNVHQFKGRQAVGSVFLPSSFISNSGVSTSGGIVHSRDTSAQLWTKNNLQFHDNDIVYDYRTRIRYSVVGYTPQFHDQYPYNGEYWFTTVELKYVGHF